MPWYALTCLDNATHILVYAKSYAIFFCCKMVAKDGESLTFSLSMWYLALWYMT